MLYKYSPILLFAVFCMLSGTRAEALTQRAFVATNGSDANTATLCSADNPCRYFQAGTSVLLPGGEVVALNSGGFGPVTITQSLSIVAPTGIHAGITPFSGQPIGVTIATAGVNVVLQGLTINNNGGAYGINMTAGTSLSVENCVISGFSGSNGTGVAVFGSMWIVVGR